MGKVKQVRAAALAVAFLTAVAPTTALAIVGPVPVIDFVSIAKLVAQVQQTMSLVNAARQNLSTLPSSISLTNIQGRMAAVTAMLQRAQSLCNGTLSGKSLPSACNVSANTANAQAQLGTEMAQLQALQNAARGVGGSLAAQQATAHATLEVAAQLQELRQLQTARALQKQIDDQAIDGATHGASPVNPWK